MKHGSKTSLFHLQMDHTMTPRHGTSLVGHSSFHNPIAMKEERTSLEKRTRHTGDRPEFFYCCCCSNVLLTLGP